MTDVIRAEVVGSMLRPQELLEAREQLAAGAITRTEFKRVEDRAVDEAIALQERCGVDVVSDGEMRRSGFVGAADRHVEGFEASRSRARRSRGATHERRKPNLAVPLTVTASSRRAARWRPRSTSTPAPARGCR